MYARGMTVREIQGHPGKRAFEQSATHQFEILMAGNPKEIPRLCRGGSSSFGGQRPKRRSSFWTNPSKWASTTSSAAAISSSFRS